jgi:hypothetical protein
VRSAPPLPCLSSDWASRHGPATIRSLASERAQRSKPCNDDALLPSTNERATSEKQALTLAVQLARYVALAAVSLLLVAKETDLLLGICAILSRRKGG